MELLERIATGSITVQTPIQSQEAIQIGDRIYERGRHLKLFIVIDWLIEDTDRLDDYSYRQIERELNVSKSHVGNAVRYIKEQGLLKRESEICHD